VTEGGPLTAYEPGHDRARDVVETGLDGEMMVTVFGRCRVDYDGRASSTLDSGDRLVILKPDGTVLVHTEEGQQPVNWQPPDCTQEVTVTDGLEIHSHRETPTEELVVTFEFVAHVVAYDVTDEHELSLRGTEADMRERILSDPSLLEEGFEPRATERETPAGAVDIYGTDSDDNAVVVELKRRRVGPDAVSQLNRYVQALTRDLHAEKTVRGILVAPSVTDRAQHLLERHGLEFVPLQPVPEA
jgi:RecB family endonuclease NucS